MLPPDWGHNAVVDTVEDDHQPLGTTLNDRRRPGRANYRGAALIALLRGKQPITPAEDEEAPTLEARQVNDLAPAEGIILGAIIGVTVCAVLIFARWYFR
jgi:hypothetical protein